MRIIQKSKVKSKKSKSLFEQKDSIELVHVGLFQDLYRINYVCGIFFLLFSLTLHAQIKEEFYLDKNFNKDKIVASVDTINITAEEFYLNYEFGPAFVKKEKDSRETHLDYMINEKLLALDGYSRRIDTTDEVSSMINEYRNDLATEELFKDKILSQIEISDALIDTIISHKQTELEIKWLYTKDEVAIKELLIQLNNGITFDSLFLLQINDTVFFDERYLKTSRYQLENKNPQLSKIIDSLKAGEVSIPFHVEDGWYIIKLANVFQNIVTTESEFQKLRQESYNSALKSRMDILSDKYVHELMVENNPVIKRDAFNVVRSYLAKFILPGEKYEEWQFEQKLNQSLKNLEDDINNSALITLKDHDISIKEFLQWYRNRSLYIKLNKEDVRDFSVSLEQLVWRMVRDNLLSQVAAENNYDKSGEVIKQLNWWQDKIVSSAVRNEIANSVALEFGEIIPADEQNEKSNSEKLNFEFQKKLLHKVLSLKQKYNIEINESELNAIPVSQVDDAKAIEFYSVKKGGLIPRTPYPTINHEWVNWE